MGKFTFENQGSDTYLVYGVDQGEKVDSYAKGMLQNNEIEGILRPSFVQKDEEQYLKYNITSKIPLIEFFREKTTKRKMTAVFISMIEGMEASEEYMLMPEGFVLDPKYIYVDLSARTACLIYLPLEETQGNGSMKDFIKKMITETLYDEHESMDYIGLMINHLNQSKESGTKELKKFLKKLEGEDVRKPVLPGRGAAGNGLPQGKMPAGSPSGQFRAAEQTPAQSRPAAQQPVQPRPAVQQPVQARPAVQQPVQQRPVVQQPVQPMAGGQRQPNFQQPVSPAGQMPIQEPKKKGFSLFGGGEKKADKKGEKKGKGLFSHKDKQGNEVIAPSGMNGAPGMNRMPSAPGMPGMNEAPGAPGAPGMNRMPSAPGVPGVNKAPGVPGMNRTPSAPGVPGMNGAPGVAGMNRMPSAPGVPGTNGASGAAGVLLGKDGKQGAFPPIGGKPQQIPTFETEEKIVRPEPKPIFHPAAGSSDDDDNRTIIIGSGVGDDGSTMMLGGSAAAEKEERLNQATVVRRRNKQSKIIGKPVFHIGKDSGFADFYIGDNGTISSAHADIIMENGQYFVRDMNSLNHTYVNGVLVEAGEMRELHSGDVLKLSNEEFEFWVE